MNRKANKQIHEEVISSIQTPEFTRQTKRPQLAPVAEVECNKVGISQILFFRAEDVSIDPETNEAIISGAPVFILDPNPTISFDWGGTIRFEFDDQEDGPEEEEEEGEE